MIVNGTVINNQSSFNLQSLLIYNLCLKCQRYNFWWNERCVVEQAALKPKKMIKSMRLHLFKAKIISFKELLTNLTK